MRFLLVVSILLLLSSVLLGQVRQSVYTGYAGFFVHRSGEGFIQVSDRAIRGPRVLRINRTKGIFQDILIPKVSLGFTRFQERNMIELLYTYKEPKGGVGAGYRHLELNFGYKLTKKTCFLEIYALVGATYLMYPYRSSSQQSFATRGFAANLGVVVNYPMTKSLYLTASLNASQATNIRYRTIRHLVGVGYRW